jgi:tRNA pseudouridine13 synthase
VERGDWNRPLTGDVFMLAGTHSIFGPEALTSELIARCDSGDIDPTGPLWGAGELRCIDVAAEIEREAAASYPELAAGLAANGLRQERRTLRLRPREWSARWLPEAGLELEFYLNSGAYATVLMREICDW